MLPRRSLKRLSFFPANPFGELAGTGLADWPDSKAPRSGRIGPSISFVNPGPLFRLASRLPVSAFASNANLIFMGLQFFLPRFQDEHDAS